MEIRTKYSTGDHVKVKADKKIKIKCPFCNGENYKVIEGNKLYCQNCEDGELISRSDEKEEVEGIIVGLRYEERTLEDADIQDENDKEYYTKVTDKSAVLVEYFVNLLDNEHWGKGTYEESQIIRKI